MEQTFRQAAAKRSKRDSTAKNENVERRRLTQLVLSLLLFVTVFLSRETFPTFFSNLEELTTKDISLSEVFSELGGKAADLRNVLTGVSASSPGNSAPETVKPAASDEPQLDLLEIEPLSETSRHGLAYYKENGLREHVSREDADAAPVETPEPEIVTAVAQAYNTAGEALPRNVSYQYYELGLEKTVVPVMGAVTSGFEYRTSPITGKREFHLALDIAAAKGTEIAAFADGVVRYIGESDDFGLYLMIDHDNGVATFYAHCSKLLVRKGDVVTCGQTVALVGDTGNATGYHLHFTIEKDNIRLDPSYYVDPEQ